MKKLNAIILLVLMVAVAGLSTACNKSPAHESIFSRPTVARVPGVKKNWLDVDSFVCYYGALTPEMYDFDVAICESRNLHAEGIEALNNAGVWTIGYISVGEDDSLNAADGLGPGGYASYYFYENGAPLVNGNWNSYFVDAGNPLWQRRIIERAGEILALGADGLFLDTLDTVDVAKYGSATIGGMVSLVKLLHDTYPDAKLVANRGFSILEYIAPYIDGMMFESFNTTWNFTTNKADDLSENANNYNIGMAVNVINKQRQYHYFPVFALDYVNDYEIDYMAQTYFDRSWQYDFIPYLQTGIGLSHVTVVDVKPQSKRGELATVGEGDIAQNEGKPNGDTSKANLAYAKNGVTVEVDSYFSIDYKNNGTAAINDAFISETMYWAKRAWASAEETEGVGQTYKTDHHVTFIWNEAQTLSRVKVYFGFDNDIYYASQKLVVQAYINNAWQDVATKSEIPALSPSVEITFSAVNSTRLRVLQPAGEGASFRRGLMWIGEIEIYAT